MEGFGLHVEISALGGELADRHDKARVAQVLKFAEIFVALLAVAGYRGQSLPLLFAALAGFGVIGALFGLTDPAPIDGAVLRLDMTVPPAPVAQFTFDENASTGKGTMP